jgi:DNA-binding winged helix-turn-helix (wHTH) protein/Tol biopolymer transport system component
MADLRRSATPIRFGAYEADLEGRELRKHGLKIRLPDQPFQLLSLLLERPGEVVTREELQTKLWPSDTFVDFDRGLNKAMNRLRDTLGDSADAPRYIETVPRRGYRFIGETEIARPYTSGLPESQLVRSIEATAVLPGVPAEATPLRASRISMLVGLVVSLAVAGWVLYPRRPTMAPQLFRSSLLPPPGSAFLPLNFAVSPDGIRLAFSAENADGQTALWIRSLSAAGAHRLDNTERAMYPFWSPDGAHLGFFAQGKLETLDLSTGVVKVLANSLLPRGGAWNRDGVIVFGADIAQPLYRIPATGGQLVPVTQLSRKGTAQTASWPCFLLDGKHFLYTVQWTVPGEASGSGLYAGSLDSRGETLVSAEITGNVAFASGHLLFVREGRIFAQPFDPIRLRLSGSPTAISEQEIETDSTALPFGFSVSQSGALVFQSDADFGSHLTWFDSSGRELSRIPQGGYRSPTLSPDGRTVAVVCEEPHNGSHSICVYDLERNVAIRITDGPNDAFPIWSRDGEEVTYESRDKDVAYLKHRAVNRSTPAQVLLKGGRMIPRAWLPDGRLLFSKVEGGGRMYLASGQTTTFLWGGVEGEPSPDGKWIAQAYSSGILVRSVEEPRVQVEVANSGAQPRWSHDGRQLFFIAPDKKLMAASFDPRDGHAGVPRVLFQTHIIGASVIGLQYDVTRDGRFLINSLPSRLSPLTLITGWTGLLKR